MPTINDADGHINDYFFGDEIARYMPAGNQFSQLFPVFDHLHFRYLMKNRVPKYVGGSMKTAPGPEEWLAFIDETGIAWSVLYPSAGLGVGRMVSVEWAIAGLPGLQQLAPRPFHQHHPAAQGAWASFRYRTKRRRWRSCIDASGSWAWSAPCCRPTARLSRASSEPRPTGRSTRKRRSSAAASPCTAARTTISASTASASTIRCTPWAILSESWCRRPRC